MKCPLSNTEENNAGWIFTEINDQAPNQIQNPENYYSNSMKIGGKNDEKFKRKKKSREFWSELTATWCLFAGVAVSVAQ